VSYNFVWYLGRIVLLLLQDVDFSGNMRLRQGIIIIFYFFLKKKHLLDSKGARAIIEKGQYRSIGILDIDLLTASRESHGWLRALCKFFYAPL
jgi:hypothetical protein